MQIPFTDKTASLLDAFNGKLYVVGGYVRNFLLSGETSKDVDMTGDIAETEVKAVAEKLGFILLTII